MLENRISVDIPNHNYPIIIDFEPVSTLEEKIFSYTKANKILLIISSKVDWLYRKNLKFKNCYKYVLKDGENQKNFNNYQKILSFASKIKLERKDAIIAIGGGVVGDIAGFVAATYLRGIDFIQIPTTLLACVDSSVGGKVGVNTKFGKNLVGAFYQPKAVLINLNFLKTLDKRQFKTGLAEILKYAFIERSCQAPQNYEFLELLNVSVEKILEKDFNIISKVIKICLELKAAVVSQDEKEQGLRKILNLGHTLGHAIEKITNYRKYTHGECIVAGMEFAFRLALYRKMITDEYFIKSIELMEKFEIYPPMPEFEPKKLIEIMQLDKKVEDGKINFILPNAKSTVTSVNDIEEGEIIKCLYPN